MPPPLPSMIPGTYDVEVAGEGTCADVITVKLCHESYVAGNIVRSAFFFWQSPQGLCLMGVRIVHW